MHALPKVLLFRFRLLGFQVDYLDNDLRTVGIAYLALEARCAALESRDKVLTGMMANVPEALVLGSNGSWIGHSDQFGHVH